MNALARNRWLPLVLLALLGVFFVFNTARAGAVTAVDVVFLVLLAGFVWWSWPGRRGSHIDHAAAQAAAGDHDVIVYWRPG